MQYREIYKEKLTDINTILDLVKSDYEIVTALGPCEPVGFLEKLHKIKDKVQNVNIVTMLSLNEYKYNTLEEMKGHFFNECTFFSNQSRKSYNLGLTSYIPTHLRYSAINRLRYKKPNIFVGSATPMDKHGFFSLSLSLVYERESLDAADIVVLQINENLPRVHGDTNIHISEVDYLYEYNSEIPELNDSPISEKDCIIGDYISTLVPDNSTLQLGIGSIPNAVCRSLYNKKNLGIHTEMITEGIVDLFNEGIITNTKKTFHKNKIVGAFALGSKKLYNFLDDNPSIELKRCSYTNDPYIISKNDNMISINTSLSIDLTGQCASESIGFNQYSGTGGQGDTGIGAKMSKGGKSIIALYSTAKNDTISRITPYHYLGSAISYSRNDVDYIVTEYGIANLSGKSIKERVSELINIAHPSFRKYLRDEANKNMIY